MVQFLITVSVSPWDASNYAACAGLAAHNHEANLAAHNHEVNKARTCLTESRISYAVAIRQVEQRLEGRARWEGRL
jgi:hypothetical protein